MRPREHRRSLTSQKHQLRVEIPDEDFQLFGDATRLSQVFQNLLDNAAKYTPDGGIVSLRAVRDGGHVAVSVLDNGIGIPSEVQARVFDMFTRVHPSDRIKSSGLGIGLALARQLVLLHDGRLEVRSAGAGQGSEFVVTLPLREASTSPMAPVDAAADLQQPSHRRVLVVDDNRDAAESLAMILDISGTQVAVALSGQEALEKVRSFAPDIVLMDIGMPGMDGYEVARRLRADEATRELLLVALTGWGQVEDRERAAEMGFDEHLTKPVDPAALDQVLALRRDVAGTFEPGRAFTGQ
jgi:CheY-like chemotaxis protein